MHHLSFGGKFHLLFYMLQFGDNFHVVLVPDTVGNLRFEDITDRAVTVIWSPPNDTNGILTGYTLRYMKKDDLDTRITRNYSTDILSVRIQHLTVSATIKLS